MQQLNLNLKFTSIPPAKSILRNTAWLDAGWATACLGFTKKVEISQALRDALQRFHIDEDEQDQQLYNVLWLAHHYLVMDQLPSFSFTFDFIHDGKYPGRLVEHSLRLHVDEKQHIILLGLLRDF